MFHSTFRWWCRSLLALPLCLTGCASLWHDLQPHRLQRLNRGPAPSLNPEFQTNRSGSPSAAATQLAVYRPTTPTIRAQQADH